MEIEQFAEHISTDELLKFKNKVQGIDTYIKNGSNADKTFEALVAEITLMKPSIEALRFQRENNKEVFALLVQIMTKLP